MGKLLEIVPRLEQLEKHDNRNIAKMAENLKISIVTRDAKWSQASDAPGLLCVMCDVCVKALIVVCVCVCVCVCFGFLLSLSLSHFFSFYFW